MFKLVFPDQGSSFRRTRFLRCVVLLDLLVATTSSLCVCKKMKTPLGTILDFLGGRSVKEKKEDGAESM